ncbi:uncharacterized protein LOC143445347 isoform X1 [Clavelina lepadiformis]|uniref:uncharacterized protein LOC143445347 isoform X1 n=1 Tax=Clavelina lepadiformis TaxID=159417 RepID=UPI00404301D9
MYFDEESCASSLDSSSVASSENPRRLAGCSRKSCLIWWSLFVFSAMLASGFIMCAFGGGFSEYYYTTIGMILLVASVLPLLTACVPLLLRCMKHRLIPRSTPAQTFVLTDINRTEPVYSRHVLPVAEYYDSRYYSRSTQQNSAQSTRFPVESTPTNLWQNCSFQENCTPPTYQEVMAAETSQK